MILKTKFSFHPKLFILFFLALTTIWSCKKDQKDDQAKTLNQIQISEAKSWLQNQKIGKRYTFDWSLAKTVSSARRTVIVLPLPDMGYGTKIITYSKLFIYKNDDGSLTGSVLQYIPNAENTATTAELASIIDDSTNINELKGSLLLCSTNGKLLLKYADPSKSNALSLKPNKSASLSPFKNDKKTAIVYGDPLANIDFLSYYPIPGGPTEPPPAGCTDYFFVTYTQTNVLFVQYQGRKCGAFNLINLGLDEDASNVWIGKVSGGDSGVGENNLNVPIDPSKLTLPQNKLCSSSFVFSTVVTPEKSQDSRGWKEAAVKGLIINVLPESYLENIWDIITKGSIFASANFDLTVGVPGDLPNAIVAKETALAANITMIQIEKSYGTKGLEGLIRSGTLGYTVAKLMQIQLRSVIGGALVSSNLSGRTTPHSPVTGTNCN